MTENPALELLRVFFAGAGFQEVPPTKTYTRDDLVRAIIAQQWAEAMRCHLDVDWGDPAFMSPFIWTWRHLPCAVDVVEGMEQP